MSYITQPKEASWKNPYKRPTIVFNSIYEQRPVPSLRMLERLGDYQRTSMDFIEINNNNCPSKRGCP